MKTYLEYIFDHTFTTRCESSDSDTGLYICDGAQSVSNVNSSDMKANNYRVGLGCFPATLDSISNFSFIQIFRTHGSSANFVIGNVQRYGSLFDEIELL